jgi:predicted AAA+ superfamily ATPase
MDDYQRPQAATLLKRLDEPVRWIHIVAGPRRVGKTTLVRQVLNELPAQRRLYVSADQTEGMAGSPTSPFAALATTAFAATGEKADAAWLIRQWQEARLQASRASMPFVLAIDEVQKIPRWSDTVKGLWDADRAAGLPMHVILLGSSPLLVQDGLTESLMGRFEPIRMGHWSYEEMHTAFGLSLDEYLYFGGYPEPIATGLYREESRWRTFVTDSLIEPSISKDIFDLERVDRQPFLRQLFWLGCNYAGQILALDNMAQNLREKNEDKEAHTGTIAKYLDLLGKASLVIGLHKYSGSMLRQRTSTPKLLALNNALMAVASGYDFAAARADRSFWGRMVENAVGAHLHNSGDPSMLTYWRKGKLEVDFVLARGQLVTAIEVKSGKGGRSMPGLSAFARAYPGCKRLVIGEDGISLVEFLSEPAERWLTLQ